MSEVQHFAYGPITPILAYAVSVLGSLLGLTCTKRVREATTTGSKVWWLLLAAWALGGTGIWTMHFLAMLGFNVVGSPVRFDIGMTALSAVAAVVVVGAGLLFVGLGRPTAIKILVGGFFTGVGVAGMHYLGTAALRVDGDIHLDQSLVIASIVIAVVAATVALWFTVIVSKPVYLFASALLMGIAVNGMHFTGMAAMSVTLHEPSFGTHGATASTMLLPIIVLVILVVIALFYALLAGPNGDDVSARAYLAQNKQDRLDEERRSAEPIAGRPYRQRTQR